MDEVPISLKVKKIGTNIKSKRSCIIHATAVNSKLEIKPLTEVSWEKIRHSAHQRSVVGCSTSSFVNICDNLPNEPNFATDGFHRKCYQRFINTKLSRKRKTGPGDIEEDGISAEKRHPGRQGVLFPSNECIICGKGAKWIVRRSKGISKREKLVKCVTLTAEESIKQSAMSKEDDVLRKINGVDLIAKEAHYHEKCRKAYTKKISEKPETETSIEYIANQRAHEEAFSHLVNYIENEIINNSVITRISELNNRYQLFLRENYPRFHNLNYSNQKLKAKIIKHFKSRVNFFQTKYRSEIVYSDEISTPQAVGFAFESSASDIRSLEKSALILRRKILERFGECKEISWPPTYEYLHSSMTPEYLTKFLQKLLVPTKVKDVSPSYERKIESLGQDICYSVTKGEWLLPKHLLLGMSVHHLTGSAQLITLFNRLGHCISYSGVLQLETSIAEKILISESVLPTKMLNVDNIITHFCWDNFDLNEETVTGHGTTHSTHGIAIQEHRGFKEENQEKDFSLQRSKRRSISSTQKYLPHCSIVKKPEPNCNFLTASTNHSAISKKLDDSDILWILSREEAKVMNRSIPGWRAWLFLTTQKEPPEFPSSVEYMLPIHHPATENATIQEVLRRSQEASQKVGQKETIVTFDLATAKKAYSIIWNDPELYKNVMIRLGSFHVICAYFNALGKLLEGSGFEEILLEAGLCVSGSLNGVMTGKHYNRALKIHTLFLEAMERLLWRHFVRKRCAQKSGKAIKSLLYKAETGTELLQECSNNKEFRMMLCDFENERSAIREGSEGPTPQFWIQHLDRIWIVLRLIKALKENHFEMYKTALKSMIPLFFSMDHPNYARYLTVYVASLEQIDSSHPEAAKHLRSCALSVTRNKLKASGTSVDQTIEQSINKHAKSCGGIVGISRNVKAYDRWCLTRHERASYVAVMNGFAGMGSDGFEDKRGLRESEMKREMKRVEITMQTICNFTNPFDSYEQESLICLSSGVQVTDDVAKEIVNAEEHGRNEYDIFVKERLCNSKTSFHAPIKKKNIKTFATLKKTATIKNKTNKEIKITAQRNVYAQLLMLAQDHDIELEKLFSFPLGPVPWPLATGDGMLSKTDKAVILHKLEESIPEPCSASKLCENDVFIIDGNVLLHSLIAIPESFGQLAEKIFRCLPSASKIHFVTDTYKELTIKATERLRRGSSDAIIISGSSCKVPRNFSKFLANDENKRRLIAVILNEWSTDTYAPLLLNREVYFVCEEDCYLLTSEDGQTTDTRPVQNLWSSQEEADTRIILHAKYADENSDPGKIIVRSTDTDVFLLLLHFSVEFRTCKNVLFDTGVGDKRRLIDINALRSVLGSGLCSSLLGFHAFTGCDTTSAFIQKGKVKALKLLMGCEQMQEAFQDIGEQEHLKDNTVEQLEKFVCRLYGSHVSTNVNSLRFIKAKERFHAKGNRMFSETDNADLSLLPPCKSSLLLHMSRANYQSFIWKQSLSATPRVPCPELHGWKLEQGRLVIHWGDEMFPKELQDVLQDNGDCEDAMTFDDSSQYDDYEEDSEDDDIVMD